MTDYKTLLQTLEKATEGIQDPNSRRLRSKSFLETRSNRRMTQGRPEARGGDPGREGASGEAAVSRNQACRVEGNCQSTGH